MSPAPTARATPRSGVARSKRLLRLAERLLRYVGNRLDVARYGPDIELAESAFRCDRVVLLEWSADDLRSEIVRIRALVHPLVGELLEMLSTGRTARGAVTAARVKRLAAAARSLVGEMWRQAGTQILAKRFATKVVAEALSDRVLDARIAGGKATA